MKLQTALIVLAALAAFLGIVVLYALEIPYLNHTLRAGRLVLVSALLGALAGAGLAHRTGNREAGPLERFKRYVALVILGAVVVSLLGALSNRRLAGKSRSQAVTFVDLEGRYASRFGLPEGLEPEANQYILTFYHRQQLHRLVLDEDRFAGKARGDTIHLVFTPGLWGFDLVSAR